MMSHIIRMGLRAPEWLRPLLGFLLFVLMPLAVVILAMALLGSHLQPLAVRALIYMSVAGAGAALACGLIGSFLVIQGSLRPWVLAFAASSAFFILMAVLSVSDVNTYARWEVALIVMGGGTVFGGAILRHFAISRRSL
jgi:hypothetical protein